MILLVFLLAVTAASVVDVVVDPPCSSCILMNTTCYNVSFVFEFQAPFRKHVVIHKMDLLRSKDILFYSFEPMIEDEEYYKIGFVNLEDPNQSGIISGGHNVLLNLGTFDIDQANEMVYFGGSDGIFVLDMKLNKISSYSSRGDTVTNIFYKNQVYFNKYEDKGIVVKQGDYFKTLLEDWPVKKFVVVEKENVNFIVFLSNLGLFVSKGDTVHRVSKNNYFRGITIDLDGTVYAWWVDGIYKVILQKNVVDSKVARVANLPSIGAMAFDNNNNILYTSDKSLYLMTKTESGCGVRKIED